MARPTTRPGRARLALAGPLAACLLAAALTGCSAPSPSPSPTTGPTHPVRSAPVRSAAPAVTGSSPAASSVPSPRTVSLAGWTLRQKVGQLFMVGVPLAGGRSVSYAAVSKHHVGNVFLAGRTTAGVTRVRNLVDAFQGAVTRTTTHGTPLLVATDQEGGEVQVLRGPGFSEIPSAMTQATWKRKKLKKHAKRWGRQLASAGVDLNLAPVMDVVTNATTARTNAPIGVFHRNYGYGPRSTYRHANAFSRGMRKAGVGVAIKHFPGLGRVAGNTDTTAHVVDRVTTTGASDPQLTSFRHGVAAGAPFVMMSSAVYSQIDAKRPAAFSRRTVTRLLRKELGFRGVVMSDDLSAAKAVTRWKPGKRAVKFFRAGGDMVLASADPSVVAPMVHKVVKRAKTHPVFAKRIDAAVRRVLAAKRTLGP